MADLRWWKLELDSTGKVLSCVPVESAHQGGRSWIYVQAADAKAATRAGMNAYMREVMRERRADLDAKGKCRWCGRKNDRDTGKRCSICLGKEIGYQKRRRDRAAGKEVPQLDPKIARAARRSEEGAALVTAAAPSLRLAVLQEVLAAWQETPTNGAFTAWLVREIEAAGGSRRAG